MAGTDQNAKRHAGVRSALGTLGLVMLGILTCLGMAPGAARAEPADKAGRAEKSAPPLPTSAASSQKPVTPGQKQGGRPRGLDLKSHVAFVMDQSTGATLMAKNADGIHPVASITKLMTALVILEAQAPLAELVEIGDADIDTERGTRSRLRLGTRLSRDDLLHLALMASENRAAHALGRSYRGGLAAFVEAMNAKARELGMLRTRFVDPTGLSGANVASAADLARLVQAAHRQPLIRRYSTDAWHQVQVGARAQRFHNTNRLVASEHWDIGLSKTGYLSEAGRCLVMQARIDGRPLVIVLLDSWGKLTRVGDANRIKKWLTAPAPQRRAQGRSAGLASGQPG